jgi:hypothetical protein
MMSTLCPPEDLVTPPRSPLTPSPGFSLLPSIIESSGGGLGGGPSIESGGGGFPSLLLHHSSPRIPIPGAAGISGLADVSSAAAGSESDLQEAASGGGVNRCCRGATKTAEAATAATLPEECEVEEEEGSSDEMAARERVQVGFLTVLRIHDISVWIRKIKKKSQNSRNQGFSYYFCLMIEGSGSGSIPLTNGPDPDPEGPKSYGSNGSGSASGSATLVSNKNLFHKRSETIFRYFAKEMELHLTILSRYFRVREQESEIMLKISGIYSKFKHCHVFFSRAEFKSRFLSSQQ